MLPYVLTHELMDGVEAFLRSTYPSSTPAFREAFDEILSGTGRGKLFQGPYLRVGLPFEPGKSGRDFFTRLETEFPPYKHQEEAFARLRTESSRSTLVATGTGSGKTECFLYPILDHILANPSEPGIKAIILYPMNALATDQARRFAKEVHQNPKCYGNIRVGLYVGGLEDGQGNPTMSETSVITDREEMRKSPPDILMTNYKMLDYLLIRRDDRRMWSQNGIETLKYLVVDELHTFDGAQGSDLACLIRRVKARVKMPKKHLCCVGTSATLGTEDGAGAMLNFASDIFGEAFDDDAIIKESRKTAAAHIDGDQLRELRYFEPPDEEVKDALRPENYHSIKDYVEAQARLWFGESMDTSTLEGRVELSEKLRDHHFMRSFLGLLTKGAVIPEDVLLNEYQSRRGDWEREHLALLIKSFASLCSIARNANYEGAYFLQMRSEIWMRELTRMVASVCSKPVIRFSLDLPVDHPQKHLAALHCRDCGVMGWGAVQKANEDILVPGLDRFYSAFFSKNPDPRLRFIFPASDRATGESLIEQFLCGKCLCLFESKNGICPECGAREEILSDDGKISVGTFRVESELLLKNRKNRKVADKSCRYCGSSTGLTIVGSRSASLTSVGLSQLFGSPYNDDKKAMAFSDSVQDASHRAGFFSARTYPIVLRTALFRTIDQQEGAELTLRDLSEAFPAYWQTKVSPEDFVGTFIPPSVEWLNEFEEFRENRKLSRSSSLPRRVSERMRWEVVREFGMQCRIGRTLEKSGAAACYLRPELVSEAAHTIHQFIHDASSRFHAITIHDCERLVVAICERHRINGGIDDPLLASYIERKGDTYLFNSKEHLPSIPKVGRRPTFFATFGVADSFERLIGSGTSRTWTQTWIAKWIRDMIGENADELSFDPIIESLQRSLEQSGLWKRIEVSRNEHETAWALIPDNLLISTDVNQSACSGCGHQVSLSVVAEDIWNGMPCLKHHCTGKYRSIASREASYFGKLYQNGDIVRLRAAEHTGMLKRDAREKVESQFMRDPSLSTDVKLLSCTPTMEMGVDVGDLSTVLLCSVPPEQANYIQRGGRGGRRDGNSLALTVATNTPHDLTFYEEPLNMIAGEVAMPAIFLRAPAVLERQLTAFCLDRWIESSSSVSIPVKMETIYMHLNRAEEGGPDKGAFPFSFYQFVEENLTLLIDGFFEMFSRGELDLDSEDHLRIFIQGDDQQRGSLCYKLHRAFVKAAKDREGIYTRVKELKTAIKKNEARSPRDEKLDSELAQLTSEERAAIRLRSEINKKQTLNFLTDEGLIPNYAFPEDGVTLRSIILKKPEKKDDNDGKLIKSEYEHMRPAEAAITELAPGNTFYVEGRRLTVDRVSIEKDDYEEWHFCKSCSHLEPVTPKSESYSECPRCHCNGWRDSSLKQRMLKMRQVFVTAIDGRRIRTLDEKDERELTSFNKQSSISFERDDVDNSYGLKAEGTTFAFEFIRRVTLREVNFGEDRIDAESVQIGGKQLQGIGFTVCNACGKIQKNGEDREPQHDIACRHFGASPKATEFENTFLLYRQLESEAIRLLIPSLNQDDNVDTQSFVAAIHLGLKKRFGGHLSHLKLSVQQVPIAGTQLRSQHVFIYDGVPGGTGYLKDLTRNKETFLDVLERAYIALKNCTCGSNDELDGCYQCIKAYRFRFVDNHISRSTAISQLERILENREEIKEQGIDQALINPLLEGELERRFIEALRQTDGFQVSDQLIDGRHGYLLRIGSTAWDILPQERFDESKGVEIWSKPDFFFRPLRPTKGKPIAVFTDGFAFHANVEWDNNRIADDIAKRMAIRMTDKFLIWSLTWADLKGAEFLDPSPIGEAFTNLKAPLKGVAPGLEGKPIFQSANWNSWTLLKTLLVDLATSGRDQPYEEWEAAASMASCNFSNRAATPGSNLRSALETLLLGNMPSLSPGESPAFMCALCEGGGMRIVAGLPIESIKEKKLKGGICALWFDDKGDLPPSEFQIQWRDFLRMFNFFQFVPKFSAFTRLMIDQGRTANVLDWLLEEKEERTMDEENLESFSEDQREELELLAPELQPVLIPLFRQQQLPWPKFGYEGTNSSGNCTAAFLEVAWPEQKLGISVPGDSTEHFIADGWSILEAARLSEDELLKHF